MQRSQQLTVFGFMVESVGEQEREPQTSRHSSNDVILRQRRCSPSLGGVDAAPDMIRVGGLRLLHRKHRPDLIEDGQLWPIAVVSSFATRATTHQGRRRVATEESTA